MPAVNAGTRLFSQGPDPLQQGGMGVVKKDIEGMRGEIAQVILCQLFKRADQRIGFVVFPDKAVCLVLMASR